MHIAILSDTHSRIAAIQRALGIIDGRRIKLIIHCGDIEYSDAVRLFPAHTHFVFGNCDYDRAGIRAAIEDIGATLHEPFGHLEIAGKTLGFTHGDDKTMLRDLIAAETFAYIFHGHTHIARDELVGPTRIINPGALHRARPKTFVILDPATGAAETIEVE